MIVAFDSNIEGWGHAPFNRAMTLALRDGFREEILLFVNGVQVEDWRGAGAETAIRAERLHVRGGSKLSDAINALMEIIRIKKIMRLARRRRARMVVALSIGPIAHWILSAFASLRRGRPPIVLVLHGELQELERGKHGPLSRAFWLRAALGHRPSGLARVVLAAGIPERLRALGYETDGMIAVEHPCLANAAPPDRRCGSRPRFVAPGGSSRLKGSDKIFALARLVRSMVGEGRCDFALVGSWDHSLASEDNGMAEHGLIGEQLSPEDYEAGLRAADFFLFPYPSESYSLMASGAIFDAVRFGVPALCLRTAYFESLFAGGPPFGRLFDSIEEMAGWIAEYIREPDQELYTEWIRGLAALRERTSPARVGAALAEALATDGSAIVGVISA